MLSILFFKQKTAYEMRISDWSSDVCSSDLLPAEMTTVEPRAFAPAIASASAWLQAPEPPRLRLMTWATLVLSGTPGTWPPEAQMIASVRSEEHTSELQSLMRISYAVFCLKNKNYTNQTETTIKNRTKEY